ncbi:hypothetical protein ACFX1X_030873 [Malus domestica]
MTENAPSINATRKKDLFLLKAHKSLLRSTELLEVVRNLRVVFLLFQLQRDLEIVVGALALVDEDLVGLRDLLESDGGFVFLCLGEGGVLVWVQLHCQLPETRPGTRLVSG